MDAQSIFNCYIDESGTLPDPLDAVIVLAAAGVETPQVLERIDQNVRKQLRATKGSDHLFPEVKFYTAGDRTKRLYLTELAQAPIDVFALVVEKDGLSIPDTPENYAVLSRLLLESCFTFYGDRLKEAVFDQHFHQADDQAEFDRTLASMLRMPLNVRHVKSNITSTVNSADMIAGSVRWKHTSRDREFYDLIHSKIVSETILHWKEAKRRFFEDMRRK